MDKQEPNDNEDDETGSKSDTEGDHFSTDDED